MLSLKNQFLVAMPEMGDDGFRETVVFIVGHGEEGAMGLIVNKTLDDMHFSDILEELQLGEKDDLIRLPPGIRNREVLRGGPVQKGRGFVLHSTDYFRDGNSYAVSDDIGLTATLDVLRAMAFGEAPHESLFALGYCGWSPGQLEGEIKGNGWLTVPYDHDLLFATPVRDRYDRALGRLGITRASLSSTAGRA
jgi:putative transcriptional regulator